MSAVSKIQELKAIVTEQNEKVKTLQRDRTEARKALSALYAPVVKTRQQFISEATAAETEKQIPEMSTEDMSRLSFAEVIVKIGKLFAAMSSSLEENRMEVHAVHKEIGAEVDAAMEEWRAIRASDDNQRQQAAFREGLFSKAAPTRPKTPEAITVPITAPATPPVDLVSPPPSTNKKEKRENGSGKQKSGTSSVADYVKQNPTSPTFKESPSAGSNKTGKK